MTKKPLPTQDELRDILEYDEVTGKLFWKVRPIHEFATSNAAAIWNSRFAGQEAFTALDNVTGYHHARIRGVRFRAHRIVWKLMRGFDPDVIDHLNHVRTDNRIENLRSGTAADNAKNSLKKHLLHITSLSGAEGPTATR